MSILFTAKQPPQNSARHNARRLNMYWINKYVCRYLWIYKNTKSTKVQACTHSRQISKYVHQLTDHLQVIQFWNTSIILFSLFSKILFSSFWHAHKNWVHLTTWFSKTNVISKRYNLFSSAKPFPFKSSLVQE